MRTLAPRQEGFRGQQMIVLPAPLWSAAAKHPLLRGLRVTDAGFFPAAGGHQVVRPAGAPTTLVIHCVGGRGWAKRGRERRPVLPGDVVWFPPGEPHAYGAMADDPWSIAWVHFTGEEAAGWRDFLAASAGGGAISMGAEHCDEVGLDRVYLALERGQGLRHQIAAACALRSALSAVGRVLVEHHEKSVSADRVSASIEAIKRDWARARRLRDLATAAGMSVTLYCAHFRRLTGFSPIGYILRLRVQQGCRLLDTTSLAIGEVARLSGFEDPYYFTRCFRKIMGCSPRQYRRMPKG